MATAMAASTCNSLPDALASTANHRASAAPVDDGAAGRGGGALPADLSATIPPEPDAEYVGSKERRTIAQWAQAGVKQGNGAALKLSSGEGEQAYLFAPTGSRGPVFLATVNFDAILHYNQSRRYALAVALLLNRLQDRPGLATPWPTDDPACRARRSRNCRTCCTTSAMTSACPTASPAPRPARPCAPSRSAATCRRTAAWASASTTRSRPHGRRWPRRRAEPARPAMTRVSGTQGYGEHAMALAERYESISFAEVHAEVAT